MLEIKDTNKFGKVVASALAKVELTVTDNQTKKRWINAISKAVVQIEKHGEFMDYDTTENHLVIWSQDSNQIYTSNGVCQCPAFERGTACWHRAAARIVRLYLELPEKKTAEIKETPYLPNTKQPIKIEKFGAVRLPVYV